MEEKGDGKVTRTVMTDFRKYKEKRGWERVSEESINFNAAGSVKLPYRNEQKKTKH